MEGLYTNAVITNAGKTLRDAAVYSQTPFEFTRFAVGNGVYEESEKTKEAMELLTGLRSEKNTYAIGGITIVSPQKVKLEFLITNFDPETGQSIVPVSYTANEIGLFAKQEGSDEEILYSIAICQGAAGDAINTYNGNNPLQVQETYSEKVGNASVVSIDLTGGYATTSALLEEVDARQQADEALQDSIDELTTMIQDNHYVASILDENGNTIVDDDNNEIAGDWRYQIM